MKIETRFSVTTRIRCPECGVEFPAGVDRAGEKLEGTCTGCGRSVSVPAGGILGILARASAESAREGEREGRAVPPARRLRRFSLAGNAAGVAVALWAIFLPRPYLLAVGSAVLVPFLLLFVLRASGGGIRLVDREFEKGPFLTAGFFLPVLAVALRGTADFRFVSLSPLLCPSALLCVLLAAAAWWSARELRESAGRLLVAIPLLFGFAWGIVIEANCLGDPSPVELSALEVLEKRVSTSGRSDSYYLTLPPWGPRAGRNEVSVPRGLYNQVREGDTVLLEVRRGRLGIPWYHVVPRGTVAGFLTSRPPCSGTAGPRARSG